MPRNSKSSLKSAYAESFERSKLRIHNYRLRRPHRSFRLTRRRDYRRSLKLPGYFAFTFEVNRTLKKFRKPFIRLAVTFALATALLAGIASQETYTSLTNTLRETGSEIFQGNFSELQQAGVVVAAIATTGLNAASGEAQQITAVLISLMVWLSTVWLLRNLLAGHKVRMRDAIYNAGAPIIPTILLGLVLLVQLIPAALAVVAYSAASVSGLLQGGVEAMLFWMAAVLLAAISLYWITSTFFAMIIATLPGMYPMQALRMAGDMVTGRRVRVLVRLLWMGLCVAIGWVVILLPVILFDTWLKGAVPQIQWLPIVPLTLLIVSTLSAIWISSYIYLLYRKVMDDNAKPA